jgi:hypothetical protein
LSTSILQTRQSNEVQMVATTFLGFFVVNYFERNQSGSCLFNGGTVEIFVRRNGIFPATLAKISYGSQT